MKKNNLAEFGLFVLISLLFSASQVFGLGIGIAPMEIKITDALRGTNYERTLTVFNPSAEDNNFTLSADGDAAEWISFHKLAEPGTPVKDMVITGKDKYSFIIKISVPDDEAVGTYNATIYVKTVPFASNGTEGVVNAVLMAKALLVIGLTGDQIVDGFVNLVSVEGDTEPGYPLRIGATFHNTGNVVATPEISVSILKDEDSVSSFTYGGTKVKPETTNRIIAEWNTTSADSVGDYMANVVVSLDGNELASNSVPFKVLPAGTISRQGNLTSIVLEDKPVVGAAVKVNSYFKNTGRIDTLAKFSGEVYLDGKRVDALSSDELLVKMGEEVPLTTYLKLQSPGSYEVKGRVVYEGKQTDIKELSFAAAESAAEGTDAVSSAVPGRSYTIIAVAVIVLAALAFIVRRKMM